MSESPYFIFFEKRKSVGKIKKNISCVKKEEEKKEKSGDSFRDIVRKKKLSMMRVMYQAANVTKMW
jgi:hypothetical protein